MGLWQTIERQSGRLYRGQSVGKLAEDLFLMWRIRVLSLRDEAYMFSLSPNEKNGIGAVSVYLKIVCFLCVCMFSSLSFVPFPSQLCQSYSESDRLSLCVGFRILSFVLSLLSACIFDSYS